MKYLFTVFAIVLTLIISGCNTITRSYGGDQTIDLPQGKKLVPYTVQWESKNNNIWYLIEDMDANYEPKTYVFKECSNYGNLEGSITFVEHR